MKEINNDFSTKDLLVKELKNYTRRFLNDYSAIMSSNDIGERINVSRSVISKYLNEMVKNGQAVRIASRPVSFFDVETLEEETGIQFTEYEYLSTEEFAEFIKSKRTKRKELESIIGADGSLNDIVRQMRAGESYPLVNGMPMIIFGESGTGKSFLCKAFYKDMLQKNPLLEMEFVNCTSNIISFYDFLFGNDSILVKRENLLIVLKDIDELDISVQKELAYFIENEFTIEKKGKKYSSSNRILFTCEERNKDNVSERLLKSISIHIRLPNLLDRTFHEKEQLVKYFFREEQRQIQKEMKISKAAYNILLKHEFRDNVDGLKTTIKNMCALANVDSMKSDQIHITVKYLPKNIFIELKDILVDEKNMIDIVDLYNKNEDDQVIDSYNHILISYHQYESNACYSKNQFIDDIYKYMNKCCDHIIFEKQIENTRLETIRDVIRNVFTIADNNSDFSLQSRYVEVIAVLVYKKMYLDLNIQRWEEEHEIEIKKILSLLQKEFATEFEVASSKIKMIEGAFDLNSCAMDLVFLTLNINFCSPNPYRSKTMGLIIAHGFATATSIANACNGLLNKYIFDAIDMPLDVSASEITRILKNYIQHHKMADNLILLVDMGSLERIGEEVGTDSNLTIGIMNNVSTKTALDVGTRIMKYEDIEDILLHVSDENRSTFKIVSTKKKNDAILFTSEAGELAAERVYQLFEKSLPKKIDVDLIACDSAHISDEILDKYHLLFIIGDTEYEFKGVQQLQLEDFISIDDIKTLRELFENYFNDTELEIFTNNLLTNFTIENVIEKITILNPTVLLSFIKKAVLNIESALNIHIDGKARISLYIHTCCMVERLITKASFDTSDDRRFVEEHSDFISVFNDSFSEITSHYHIDIPISQIISIYNYIFDWSGK